MEIYRIYLKTKNGLFEASDCFRDLEKARKECDWYNYTPDLKYVVGQMIDNRVVEI